MALGELTKQIAQQALLSATTTKEAPPPAPAAAPENLGAVIFGQIAAMQKALKEDEELAVFVQNEIRVREIFAPSRSVLVLTGTDANGVFTRVISPAESLQLVCKVFKIASGAKPLRVALLAPKTA
jgi:hypothetical protein